MRLTHIPWRELKYALWLPLYLLAFVLVEHLPQTSYWPTQLPLDSAIPFCEWFVLFYCAWYPLLVAVGLYLLLVINVAAALGIDITGVVALASVLTLAVSLALQNMLANVIGGFTILTTHPFHSGDFVDIGGQSGTVEEISMTYTQLATPDNKIVSIPNNTVVGSQITNYSVAGTRRVDINVTAAYTAPAQDVIDALLQAGNVEKVLRDPAPFAALT